MRSLKGQKVFDPRTHRQPHSLTTCFVSHAILHDEIEYFGKKSWGFGGFSGLQFPQGGGKKVTRCSWVDTSVWRPGDIPNPKNITSCHLVGENNDSPSSWMNGGSSWEWIWILRPASYEISSKNWMTIWPHLTFIEMHISPDSFHMGMYSSCWISNNSSRPLSTPPLRVFFISSTLSGLLNV